MTNSLQSGSRNVRCAIYTRKSTEEGLDQDFNSLDAQREAAEAYIASQRSEGWGHLPQHYDDGGYSGGTLERPALKQLLADIEAGQLDVVVVYKIDRLSRSLMDFAKLVELFERRNVTFVSVTQAFNTTNSMGRLTLNILLSFAQFEREIIGERVRDKIAASKKKGMWMGGPPPLGYEVQARKLVVNEIEAATVRSIYEAFLQIGCVRELVCELQSKRITSKSWTSGSGKLRGGQPFQRGGLYGLLRNRIYLGEVVHKGNSYPGEHIAIVPPELFDGVQRRLMQSARRQRGQSGHSQGALLAGLVYDDRAQPMAPTYSVNRAGLRYRYYSSRRSPETATLQKRVSRIPAPSLENFLRTALFTLRLPSAGTGSPGLRSFVRRVEIGPCDLVIWLDQVATLNWWRSNQAHASGLRDGDLIAAQRRLLDIDATLEPRPTGLALTWKGRLNSGKYLKVLSDDDPAEKRPTIDPALVSAIARAHRWRRWLQDGEVTSIAALARKAGGDRRHVGKTLALAFLSPDLTRAILDGNQPRGLRLSELLEQGVSLSWREQRLQILGRM